MQMTCPSSLGSKGPGPGLPPHAQGPSGCKPSAPCPGLPVSHTGFSPDSGQRRRPREERSLAEAAKRKGTGSEQGGSSPRIQEAPL